MTRWHGMTIGSGLQPLACPTARAAPGWRMRACDVAVVAHGAVGDLAQRLPDAQLEIRAVRRQVEVELAALAREVLAELRGDDAAAFRVAAAFGAAPVEPNLDEPAVAVDRHRDRAPRRRHEVPVAIGRPLFGAQASSL